MKDNEINDESNLEFKESKKKNYVVAIADYKKNHEKDLEFEKGTRIEIIK